MFRLSCTVPTDAVENTMPVDALRIWNVPEIILVAGILGDDAVVVQM